ncbi:uncharacterized protein ColSpa_06214 [Colletotrichum spaethianum]|uniref:Uncharacterized protein n=1 Tax=Colletotrichum spaethianum TaxID=700344 RepID=A0AA37LCS7_9PEZI|nr:uncharacterized protein ColSpa_06214 [Colletotrichum spaethianum]GKT46033.1 hypothetical protein ColSpa_06214 [Colletotrichum spaethianum]
MTIEIPKPLSKRYGNPSDKNVSYYGEGGKTERMRMDNAANSFSNGIGNRGNVVAAPFVRSSSFEFPYNGGIGSINIKIRFEVNAGCWWKCDYNECRRYLSVPVYSCNAAASRTSGEAR